MPKEASGTQVVGARFTPEEVKRVQAIAGKLSERAGGVSVTIAEVVAILVRRDLPRYEAELEITSKPAAKKTKAA